jgi:hypothetical protein
LLIVFTSVALAISLAIRLNDSLWHLADEVYDGGDFLVVRRRGEEETVPLSNIVSVMWINRWKSIAPPRITLRLAHPGKFGSEIVFRPKRGIDEKRSTSKVAEYLNARINNSRFRGAA